ncbi:MAG TPA: transcriptional repressor LexA [Candidatus Acidoferrum sp.]|nr:transcriptional repressor LexA [Candidatus Acidoferrum sp.]
MITLTKRQREVLDFVIATQQEEGSSPTLREICEHFGFRSPKAAADHLTALQRKGALSRHARRARSLRITSPLQRFLRPVVNIPIYGSIPAGFADERQESAGNADGCVSVDLGTLGLASANKLFALRVRGDSMIGKHIVDGDIAILDAARTPRANDVVAALIDGESTLKTFAMERGKAMLRAENPRYPTLIPAQSLEVQGVMVALVRRPAA